MAKINDVQVIEKNTGEKIQWEQDGYRLSFDDDALSIKVTKYQGDEARTLDVCMDRGGDLMLGTQPGGRYVAQIEIPAATYTEAPDRPMSRYTRVTARDMPLLRPAPYRAVARQSSTRSPTE